MIIYNVIVYNIRTLELSKELVRAVIADAPFSHGLPLRCEFCRHYFSNKNYFVTENLARYHIYNYTMIVHSIATDTRRFRQSTINRRRVRPMIQTRYIWIEQNLRVTRVRWPGRDEKNANNNKIIISGATPGLQVYRWRVPTTGSRQERLEKIKKGPGGECPEKGHTHRRTTTSYSVWSSFDFNFVILLPQKYTGIWFYLFYNIILLLFSYKIRWWVRSSKLLISGAMFRGKIVTEKLFCQFGLRIKYLIFIDYFVCLKVKHKY